MRPRSAGCTLFETLKTPLKDAHGEVLGVLGIARDVTARQAAERRIQRLNRIYAVLSGIKGAIVRQRDPESLYRAACRVAVDVGGFKLAWIGQPDPESGHIEPVAHSGDAIDYPEPGSVSPRDAERAEGPAGLAILRGGHVVCNALASDPRMMPWRDALLARGFRASAAFPIWVAGSVRGVFSLYTDHEDFFDTEEVRLLDDLTADLGVALELIEATAALRAQRDILDRTSHLAKVGGWGYEVATGVGAWTAETARILGIEPSDTATEEEGLRFFQGVHREKLEAAIAAAVEEAIPYDLELEMVAADGTRKWVRTQGRPILEAGRVLRLEGAIQDITGLKEAMTEARESGNLLDSVFQTLPDLFFLMDAEGRLLDFRGAHVENLYLPPEEFLGRLARDVLPPEVSAAFEQNLALVRQSDGLVSFEYALTMPTGLRHFEARLSQIPEKAQILTVVRDITDRKRIEDEIRRLNGELEARVRKRTAELAAINKELETFTYSVSHDLKAPLRGIDGYSRLLLEDHAGQLDDEGRLFLDNVRRGVEQMGELIEDLLAYSRMERRGLHDTSVVIADLIARILAERADEIRATSATIELELEDGLTARADPDGLALVLRNLLDNALKFKSPDASPRVRICGCGLGDSTMLSVSDQGIGFDMQFHDRIFQIFQRLQRAEDYPGTGIGLAMVGKAVRRMRGRIWADSMPGQGATFYLELPR